MIRQILILVFMHLFLMGVPQKLQAQVDPKIQWREIETQDAYWVFDAKHYDLALHYIREFERAKAKVLPLFKEKSRKMTILLVDNSDSANGSAQISPHPVIVLLLVNPSYHSSIGEFKDFIHTLLVHEYTHILNMEPTHGLMSILYWIFGSVAHPNMTLPRWYTEGLAVYTESLLSENGGRLNSQYLEGLARSLTLENKWGDYPISELNDSHPDWLGASRAYLFGGILWDSIVREKGIDIIHKMNQKHSRRLPYLLNKTLKEQMGRGYHGQLKKAYAFWQQRAQKQIDRIQQQSPPMPNQLVDWGKGRHSLPTISPDGSWMLSFNNDDIGSNHIYLHPRHPKRGFLLNEARTVVSDTQTQSLNWHPQTTGFVYEKSQPYKLYYHFYDLYFYDLKSKKSIRLTQGARAHQSCFAPNGDTLYFLQNQTSSKNLVAMDWKTKTQKVLYQSPIGDDLRNLCCLDDHSVLFVEKQASSEPHMIQWDTKKNKKESFFDQIPVGFVKITKRGIVFSSNNSGVENLYLLNPENKKFRAITNSLTRVVHGDIDPLDENLYFTQLTSQGLKTFHLQKEQWENLPSQPPKVDPIVDYLSMKTPKLVSNNTKNSGNSSDTKNTHSIAENAKKSGNTNKNPGDTKNAGNNKNTENSSQTRNPDNIAENTKNSGNTNKNTDDTKNTGNVENQKTTKKWKSKKFSSWRYLYPNYWIPFIYFIDGGSLFQAITSAGDPLGIHQFSLTGQWDTLTKKPGASIFYLNRSSPINVGLGLSDFYTFFYSTRSNLHISRANLMASYPLKFLDNTRVSLHWNYSVLDFQSYHFSRQGPQIDLSYGNVKQRANDISPSTGWRFQLGHKNFLSDLGNTIYEETYAHIGSFWSSFTPDRHNFYLGLNSSYAPQLRNVFFATNTLSGPFFNPTLINRAFLQRGYPTGLFVARNIVNTNVEYHFPLISFYRGTLMPPLFLKNLKGAFVFDATTLDGRYSDKRSILPQTASMGRWFTGYGLELESSITMGFHVPVTFTLGLYYGHQRESFGGFNTFFNIRL